MTPKQKAQDLVNTYRIILMDEDTDCGNEILCTSIAIKNALVAVNEIWNALESARAFEEYNYWQEVRQEIKKL
jgi:siderophore synthetase component